MKSPATATPSTSRSKAVRPLFQKFTANIQTVTVVHGDKGTGKTTLADLICISHITQADVETATSPAYRVSAYQIRNMTLHLLMEEIHRRGTRHLVVDADKLQTALGWLKTVNLKPTRVIHLSKPNP